MIVIGSLTGGGAERVCVALARYLSHRGHLVRLVTMHDESYDFYHIPRTVKRSVLGFSGRNRGFKKITANVGRVRFLRQAIKTEESDIVIGITTIAAVLTILACFGLPARSIVSERNYPGRKEVHPVWGRLRSLSYRFAAAHVAQTVEARNWLVRYTSAKNVHVIPNPVLWPLPSTWPEVQPDGIVERSKPVILNVGTKPHQKGMDLLIEAFASLSEAHGHWELVILGVDIGSVEGKWLSQLAAESGVTDRVHLPGRIGNMRDWYQRADLFVLSSRYEGLPNVLLEAMAAGCPSISFDCDAGPRDVVKSGVNGLLVPAEDVKGLAESLEKLISLPEMRRRLGEAGKEVRYRFSEERVLAEWERLIVNT